MRYTTDERIARVTLRVFGAMGLVLLVAPIVVIMPLSFNAEGFFNYPMPGLSLRWYKSVVQSDAWVRALKNSLIIGLATTVIATVIGALAALGISRLKPRLRATLVGIFMLPVIVPGVVVALGLFLFYSSLDIAGTLFGVILSHVVLGIPFVVITLTTVLTNFDTNLMRAAMILGASPIVAYRRIMLPLVAPAVASSALFVFVTSFDEFIVTSFLAGPKQSTLPLQMWSGVHDDVTPAILAVAMLFVLASIMMLASVEILRRRLERLGTVRTGEMV